MGFSATEGSTDGCVVSGFVDGSADGDSVSDEVGAILGTDVLEAAKHSLGALLQALTWAGQSFGKHESHDSLQQKQALPFMGDG